MKNETSSELLRRKPSDDFRFGIIALAVFLFFITCLYAGGLAGFIVIPLGLLAGWIEASHRLFGNSHLSVTLMNFMGAGLFLIGAGFYFGARRRGTWIVGFALLMLLLFLPIYGCSKMGRFIDG